MSKEAYSVYAPCMYKPSYTAYAERMERYLADPHVLTFVCEEDGEKTGMLVLDTSADIPEIAGIAVAEARRRMGSGSFMIRQLMNAGYVDKLLARTDESAVGFYRKCGFSAEKQMVEYPDGTCARYICRLFRSGAPLEEMGAFFDARLEGYEEHQLTCIESAQEFYPYTALCLPEKEGSRILDLGCGTGLELGYYFERVPAARVAGIDLAPGMLEALRRKFPDKDLKLIRGSYFDVPFGEEAYDAAVSVESLHHFTKEEKIPLYRKLHRALRRGGYFILTDYFAPSEEKEELYRRELTRLKKEQGLGDAEFYHYDTPLTLEHEREALLAAGFARVTVLKSWGATSALRADQ